MNDPMNPLVQFSPFAGTLYAETVPGETSRTVEYENDVHAAAGNSRTMYCYAPRSGCPDPKQTQVLMVLRKGDDQASAESVMKTLGLDHLAEQEHFLLLFPNPGPGGWNYTNDPERDNDMDYLVRCFGFLRNSKVGVNGFNGMIFYIAACPEASALLMTMAARRPINVPAMMISDFPEGYQIPEDALGIETAAWCSDPQAADYLTKAAEASQTGLETDGVTVWQGRNPAVKVMVSSRPLDEATVTMAWDKLFSQTRRWQNDTHGGYHARTAFTERGFVAHVNDSSLGVNNGFAHTWYEYIPPQLRGTTEKVPLVFYFHGVNCVPLYGAEQSNWHEIADRENFIVVYPAPARNKAWNIFDVPALPSDFDFVLALLEHMKTVHPIDETRVYLSGFSMGGMMTHALSAAHPELFAAAAPCNAFAFGRFKDPAEMLARFIKGNPEQIGHVSYSAKQADEKKAQFDYRMPLFQNAGAVDEQIGAWPVDAANNDCRMDTIRYWKAYNHIRETQEFDPDTTTGLAADETFFEDAEGRYCHQRWHADGFGPALMELVVAARMPHAIDPVQIEWAWRFIKQFARAADGSLIVL